MALNVPTKPKQSSGPAQAPAVRTIPFATAARQKTILSFQQGPFLLGSATVSVGPIQIPANGYMRALNIEFNIVSAGNTATVAITSGDTPFNILQQFQMVTSSGDSLIVPIDGYALYIYCKWAAMGMSTPYSDPRSDPTFVALTTGAGATAGSGTFRLRVPFEIDEETGFGSLANLSANRSYNIQMVLNSLTNVFSVIPNGTVNVTITALAEYWSVPNQTNAQGTPQETAPLGDGSYAQVQIETITVAAGANLYQLHNMGSVIRQIILILRDTSNVRVTTANSPGVFNLILNNDSLFYLTRNEFRRQMAASGYGAGYGAVAAANDTAQGQDTGVWVYTQFSGPGQSTVEGHGPRTQYLPTLPETLMNIQGTSWGVAGTLQSIISSVVPTDATALYMPHIY